jgi:hypothetical protein
VKAFLSGLGIGIGLGLLFAPDRGEVTRSKVRERITDLYDGLSQQVDRAKEAVGDQPDLFASRTGEQGTGNRSPKKEPAGEGEPFDSRDLQYQDLSPNDLMSQDLTDINEAGAAALRELGLDQQSSERLIENRPYRNKLDLVSRMILSDEMYAAVKDKIAVAKGRESIKVA